MKWHFKINGPDNWEKRMLNRRSWHKGAAFVALLVAAQPLIGGSGALQIVPN